MSCSVESLCLQDLPPELLLNIFTRCDVTCIGQLASTCRQFSHLARLPLLWRDVLLRCYPQLRKTILANNLQHFPIDWLTVARLLCPWSWLMGLWWYNTSPRGSLLFVSCSLDMEQVTLTGNVVKTARNDPCGAIVSKPVFSMTGFLDGSFVSLSAARCQEDIESCRWNVIRCIPLTDFASDDDEDKELMMLHHVDEGSVADHGRKYFGLDSRPVLRRLQDCSGSCSFDSRLSWRIDDTAVSLEPGFYQGTYGLHGIELLQLTWVESILTLLKITGDENVPSGKVSVCVDLNQPLSVVQCDSTESSELEDDDSTSVRLLLPADSWPEEWTEPRPQHCRLAFDGQGQIAWTGYYNPRFIDGNFFVLDERTCAFVWFELSNKIAVFKKIRADDHEYLFTV